MKDRIKDHATAYIGFYLEPEDKEKLTEIFFHQKMNMSEGLRWMIKNYIKENDDGNIC